MAYCLKLFSKYYPFFLRMYGCITIFGGSISFLFAVVTKLPCNWWLKTTQIYYLQFCRLEVQQECPGLKSRCQQDCIPSGGSRGGSFTLSFPAASTFSQSLGCGPAFIFRASSSRSGPSHDTISVSCLQSHIFLFLWDYISPTWTNQGDPFNISWSASLILFTTLIPLCHIIYSEVPGIRTFSIFQEPLFYPPQLLVTQLCLTLQPQGL